MRKYSLLLAMLLTLALALPAAVQADVVGRVTQVEGQVDLLKGGKLPATPTKVDDSVQTGDVVRTKSLSRAQLTFMDNTIITIAPGSRLAIEEYLFEPTKSKRNAVLQLFQGLVHVVVTKLFQVEQPDFIIKTHTAVLGVRGTELGVRLAPNSSTILNFKGITRVANIFPEVGDLRFKRAQKVAFSFPPAYVECHDMQGTTVFAGLPPTKVFAVSREDQKQFMGQVVTGLTSRKGGRDAGTGTIAQVASGRVEGSSTAGTSGSGSSVATDSATAAAVPSPAPPPPPTQPTIPPSGSTAQTTAASGTATTDTASTGGGGVDTTSFSTLASDTPLLSDTGTGTGTATTTAANTVINSITAPTGTGVGVIPSQVSQVIIIPPEPTPTDTGGTTPPVTYIPPTDTGGTTPPPVVPPVEPPITPPQTSVTYTYVSVSYSQWLTTYADPTGKSQTTTSTGWSQRTGLPTSTYPTYYTWTGTGTRTVEQGALYPTSGSNTGTSYSVLSGSVTGLQGGTLTGTATSTGYNSWGGVSNYSGTITIEPSGRTTFAYGGTITDFRQLASATGTNISVPGTYFTQTLDGTGTDTSEPLYNIQTSRSTWAGGSRTGVLPGYYSATLNGASTSQWTYSYLPQSYSGFTSTLAGVVSPGSGGIYTGAATIFPGDPETPFKSGLTQPPSPYLFPRADNLNTPIVSSVTIQPNGSAFGIAYDNWYNDGRFESAIYNLNQTPVSLPVTGPASADYNFSQTFNGAMHLNTGAPGTLLANAQGWGQRTGVYPGYFSAWTDNNFSTSNWTLTSGSLPTYWGQTSFGSPISVTRMDGTVSGVLGKTLNGTMYFYGSLLGGTSFSYSGPVKIENDGYLQFTIDPAKSTWQTLSGSRGTASGTLNQFSGYYFNQSFYDAKYTLTSNGTNGTLSVSEVSGSPNNGVRSYVDPGSLGSFSATYDLYSPTGDLPVSSSGPTTGFTTISAEGVVTTSELGAKFGNATYYLGAPFNYLTLGFIGVTPNGGSLFNTGGIFVSPTLQVNSANIVTPSVLYAFTQTYNGFRLGTSTSPFSLASIEGYAWGQRTGVAAGGAVALPASYSPNGGYFVAQNLATAASAPGVLTPNWLSVTGSMSGRVSGAIGSTLSGNMTFTGTSSLGTTYSYQGSVALSADGKLVFMYNGTAQTVGSSAPNITQAGVIQQVPGTYFSETASGTVQTSTASVPTGTGYTVNTATVKDATPFTGNRTMDGTTTPTTASLAGMYTSTVATYTGGGSGPAGVSVQGVVAGATWENRFGVATTTLEGVSLSGPVTLDPTGKLTGQAVDQIPNGTSSPDKVVINAVSVPTTSGQTTSSFVQTLSGGFTATANGSGTQSTLTAPALTGTSTGTLSGNINGVLATTNTTAVSGTLATNAGNTTAYVVGTVGGPAGGLQTGTASTQMVNVVSPTAGIPLQPRFEGTAVLTPAAGSSPPALSTNLNGVLNLVPPNATQVQTTGGLVTTPKP